MAHYSGKKKGSTKKRYRRSRQAIHVPRIPRVGGSFGRSKNYFRNHDFKYEREPPIRPPEVETSYVRDEKPSYERNAAPHPFPLKSKFIPNTVGDKVHTKVETSPEEVKNDAEVSELPLVEPGIETHEMESAFDVTVEAEPSAFSGIAPDIVVGPELYEAYELPAKDLELLLAELDVNALQPEVQPEKKLEAESPSEV